MGNACVLRGGFSMQNAFPFSLPTDRNNLLENAFVARLRQGGCFFARV